MWSGVSGVRNGLAHFPRNLAIAARETAEIKACLRPTRLGSIVDPITDPLPHWRRLMWDISNVCASERPWSLYVQNQMAGICDPCHREIHKGDE
jgi:hypothetical protein